MARMPSDPDAESTPEDSLSMDAGAAAPALQLAQASRALWIATLSLMTAFMQTPAPAHRYLLARRIGRNLDTLARQDCFDAGCRARFVRLARRWHERAEQFAPGAAAPRSRLFALFS
jgi:hypothetical protein